MLAVPANAVPNQQLQCQLGGQAVTLNVYQQQYGLYMDVFAGDALIIAGVLCLAFNRIVRDLYLGFVGDFIWIDTLAPPAPGLPSPPVAADPVYTGIGSQFLLMYLEASDLAPGQG